MKVKTKTEEAVEERIRKELETLTVEINKLQWTIDDTEPWPLLKELCKAKTALESQRNAKINLLNTVS